MNMNLAKLMMNIDDHLHFVWLVIQLQDLLMY